MRATSMKIGSLFLSSQTSGAKGNTTHVASLAFGASAHTNVGQNLFLADVVVSFKVS